MSTDLLSNSAFFLVGNIPGSFRSANLRNYFSQYVEKKSFSCFHYKHRPEHLKHKDGEEAGLGEAVAAPEGSKHGNVTSKCCVVAVKKKFGGDFSKMYQNKNWSHHDGSLLVGKVRISNLRVTKDQDSEHKTDFRSTFLPWDDLSSLPELNPPNVMPQGNVGTPLSTFMSLIRTCKLPGHVIKKLQLEFPKSRSSKRYGAVKFDYGGGVVSFGEASTEVDSEECGDVCDDSDNEDRSDPENDRVPSDDDHDAEEWERYEALHDDVDKQGRTKERLFEEDLEVVWEKGGSGLVFYTDASHWDQQDGDFDEKCSQEDDWDVDMSVYYEPGGGSKDALDMRTMEMERRLRVGEELSESWREPGGFEKYTKGIGSKVLRRSGWVAGSGVGASNQGITEPVESDGQLPSNKRGFGYRGEKLNRYMSSPKRRKVAKDVIISTVYDKPEEEEDTILRTAPLTVLKHRATSWPTRGLHKQGGVKFSKGGTLEADCDRDKTAS